MVRLGSGGRKNNIEVKIVSDRLMNVNIDIEGIMMNCVSGYR